MSERFKLGDIFCTGPNQVAVIVEDPGPSKSICVLTGTGELERLPGWRLWKRVGNVADLDSLIEEPPDFVIRFLDTLKKEAVRQ